MDGIRLQGIPESEDKTPRQRYEHDKRAVNLMLQHLNINTEITDIRRMGVFQAGRARTIVFKVATKWDKRLILSSVAKLKMYEEKVFLSRELPPNEAKLESQYLKKRKELIDSGVDRKSLRMKDGKLQLKNGDDWQNVQLQADCS